MLSDMEEIQEKLLKCVLFISIGTSGQVYPAAGFVALAKEGGAKTIEINLKKTPVTDLFERSLTGKASEKVPEIVEEILKGVHGK